MTDEAKDAHSNSVEKFVSFVSLGLCTYMFYSTLWGPYKTTIVHRAIFLGAMMLIFFWSTRPLRGKHLGFFLDSLLVIMAVFAFGYVVIFWESILNAIGGTYLSKTQIVVGIIIVLASLEAVRRASLPLLIIAITAVCYTLFGNYIPGALSHAHMGFRRFIYLTAFSHEGVFGLGLAVASTYLFMFILFSTMLQETGAADFFLKLTNSLVGKTRGGPAKSAVIASGLTGTMIGSSIGNVVTTGSITIPMMKESGFKDYTAGAIEVVSSEGSQLVPPIMGAGAFLMAELTGIPYQTIAIAAIIPALLYYVSVFIVVDMEAVKLRMKGLKRTEKSRNIIREGGQYLIPVIVLFYLLLATQFTVTFAGLVTTLVAVAINQLRKKTRLSLKRLFLVFDKGTRMSAEITALIAVIGIVQQAFTITGLGPRLSDLLVIAGSGHPILVLMIAMLIAILLGMGLPTPIAYLLSGIFVAPALVELGFSTLAAHLFLFFFAIKSGSTPPIAVVAVVAAGIAKADWLKTSILSFIYSLPGFFIAYAFVLLPGYLMNGSLTAILTSLFCGLVGVCGIAYVMQRHFLTKLALWEMLLLGVGSYNLIFRSIVHPAVGFSLILLVGISQLKKSGYLKIRQSPKKFSAKK